MKALLTFVVLVCFCANAAWAVQTCPAGNPRIAPDNRYTDNGNNTITDNQTGLMWKKCSEGQSGLSCAGTVITVTWSVALAAGPNSSFAGFNDWRLPDVKELKSLVESACYSPAINEVRFPNTLAGDYWTSSSYARNASIAWSVDFNYGFAEYYGGDKSNLFSVRLVRGGH